MSLLLVIGIAIAALVVGVCAYMFVVIPLRNARRRQNLRQMKETLNKAIEAYQHEREQLGQVIVACQSQYEAFTQAVESYQQQHGELNKHIQNYQRHYVSKVQEIKRK